VEEGEEEREGEGVLIETERFKVFRLLLVLDSLDGGRGNNLKLRIRNRFFFFLFLFFFFTFLLLQNKFQG
jgi:hypothetical protein